MSVSDDFGEGVSRCTDGELDELLGFRRRMYDEGSPVADPARARWLFGQNPAGRPPGALAIWIARRDGSIVGTRASIPCRLKLGDDECQAHSPVDTMVDPPWRGKGVAGPLTEAIRAGNRISFSVGSTPQGYRLSLRNDATPMGTVPVYVHLIDARGVFREAVTSRPRLRAAAPLIPVAGPLGGLMSQLRSVGADPVAVDAFDERADAIWRDVSSFYPVISRRDATWLRWRFDECPNRDDYRRWYVLRGKRVAGYFVLRPRRWHGDAAFTIVDYLGAPRDLAALFACAVRVARAHHVSAVLCPTLNAHVAARLHSVGFLRLRRASQAIRITVWCEADDPARDLVIDPKNWFLTAANSDVDEYQGQVDGRDMWVPE